MIISRDRNLNLPYSFVSFPNQWLCLICHHVLPCPPNFLRSKSSSKKYMKVFYIHMPVDVNLTFSSVYPENSNWTFFCTVDQKIDTSTKWKPQAKGQPHVFFMPEPQFFTFPTALVEHTFHPMQCNVVIFNANKTFHLNVMLCHKHKMPKGKVFPIILVSLKFQVCWPSHVMPL